MERARLRSRTRRGSSRRREDREFRASTQVLSSGWRPGRYIEGMAAGSPPDVRKGLLKVPEAPEHGLEIDADFLKKNLAPGEEYWG